MKKLYQKPEIEFVEISNDDIVTGSRDQEERITESPISEVGIDFVTMSNC